MFIIVSADKDKYNRPITLGIFFKTEDRQDAYEKMRKATVGRLVRTLNFNNKLVNSALDDYALDLHPELEDAPKFSWRDVFSEEDIAGIIIDEERAKDKPVTRAFYHDNCNSPWTFHTDKNGGIYLLEDGGHEHDYSCETFELFEISCEGNKIATMYH